MNRLQMLAERLGDDLDAWSASLSAVLERAVCVQRVVMHDKQRMKAQGMTQSIELQGINSEGSPVHCYLKMPDESMYGEYFAGDLAREIVWRLDGYGQLPNHATCLAVARISNAGKLLPAESPLQAHCVVEASIEGELYSDRLAALDKMPDYQDAARDARLICSQMCFLHRPLVENSERLYRRAIRDGLMNAVFRLIDGGDGYWAGRTELRSHVEHAFLDWRLFLAQYHHRLCTTHNDYHPWNIFLDQDQVRLIGARAPGFGDAANDVAALMINYVWFSYLKLNDFGGPYREAYESFWSHYLAMTGDAECTQVFPPFFAMRLLVLLNPIYYPNKEPWTIRQLERLLVAVLNRDVDVLEDGSCLSRCS